MNRITAIGWGRVLFYRASDGRAETGAVNSVGDYIPLQTLAGVSAGWTHITTTSLARLLFYRSTDGLAETGSINNVGGYNHLKTVGGFARNWTHIITADRRT